MNLTDAELEAKLAAVAAKAKAPLLEDLHTLTRALADEHRRVDVAIEARHKTESERNGAISSFKSMEKENKGLQFQVEQLATEVSIGKKFHLEVIGCLTSHGIPTPQAGYLNPGSSSILRDLDALSRVGKKTT